MQSAVERFRELLSEHGYRVTPQRLAIYEALISSPHHPSAEELYQQVNANFPMISPATVYNTLQLLVKMGLATETGFPGEVRYDGNPDVHINILCIECRGIFDVEDELAGEIFERVRNKTRFTLLGQRHEFFGICPECSAKGAASDNNGNGARNHLHRQ